MKYWEIIAQVGERATRVRTAARKINEKSRDEWRGDLWRGEAHEALTCLGDQIRTDACQAPPVYIDPDGNFRIANCELIDGTYTLTDYFGKIGHDGVHSLWTSNGQYRDEIMSTLHEEAALKYGSYGYYIAVS